MSKQDKKTVKALIKVLGKLAAKSDTSLTTTQHNSLEQHDCLKLANGLDNWVNQTKDGEKPITETQASLSNNNTNDDKEIQDNEKKMGTNISNIEINKERTEHASESRLSDSGSGEGNIYPGAIIDETPPPSGQHETFNFPDPSFVACLFDDDLRLHINGTSLHPWQVEVAEELANAKPTSKHPYKFCLRAANGSGKDKYVIAPFCIWFACTKVRSRVILTSSSGTQLTSQTETYIKDLAEKVNSYFNEEIFLIRQRYVKCLKSGSEIRMFATDEKGKAEGYHPWDANSEMAIIVNEGKSVTEDIHGALRRCTGYNYWLEVSTPGEPHGFFYNAATSWKHTRVVTSFDCPHLAEDDREEDKRELGEHSALYRSKHLAEFTSVDTNSIIPIELINSLVKNPPVHEYPSLQLRIGIDIAAGGDETTVCFTKGNKCIKEFAFREKDTTVTADRIERILKDEKIDKNYQHVYIDGGGIGHGVIDVLRRKGWEVNEIHNQWAPLGNKKMYGNRGAENWYRVKRLFEELVFDASTLGKKTREQLAGRHYKQGLIGARIMLEKKSEAKAHGRPSPDRADAFILSLTGLTLDDFLAAEKSTVDRIAQSKKIVLQTEEDIEEYLEKINKQETKKWFDDNTSSKRIFNSLSAAMEN